MTITVTTSDEIAYAPDYDDLSPAEMLVRLDALKKHCVTVGTAILGGTPIEAALHNLMEGATVNNIFYALVNYANSTNNVDKRTNAVTEEHPAVDKINTIVSRSLAVIKAQPEELFPLLACKNLVEGFVKGELSGTFHQEYSAETSVGLEALGLGGSKKGKTAGDVAVGLKFTAYLVPLAEWLNHLIKASAPSELPTTEHVIEMYLRGKMGDQEAQGFLALNGCSWQLWKQVALSRAERPSILEIVQDSMRQVMGAVPSTAAALKAFHFTDEQSVQVLELVASACKQRGYAQGIDPEIFVRLFQELPTITDHLHWLARNADDLEYLSEFNLWAGFSDKATVVQMFTELAERTGYDQAHPAEFAALIEHVDDQPLPAIYANRDFYATFKSDLIAQGQRTVDSFLHYVAHWLQPALGEQREMLWRLRPGAVAPELEFGPTQLLRAMSEKDIAPFFQERLLAIAYHVIPLRFLRSLYNYSSLSSDQAQGILQDQGYTAADAATLVSAMELQRKLWLASQGHGNSPQELQALLAGGQITEEQYVNDMEAFGFPTATIAQGVDKVNKAFAHKLALQVVAQVRRDFVSGLLTETQARNRLADPIKAQNLIDLTINEWTVEKELKEQEDTKKHADEVKKQKTAVIKTGFLDGRWDIGQAAAMLSQAGVTSAVIAELSDLWTLELTAKSKWPPLADLKAAAKDGNLPAGQFAALLASMNYSPEAIGVEVAEVLLAKQNATQKQQDALAKQLAAQAAKLTRSTKHQASIAFNYKSAVQKADLSVELANETDKLQKAQQKAALAKLLAAGKEQVDLMPPV